MGLGSTRELPAPSPPLAAHALLLLVYLVRMWRTTLNHFFTIKLDIEQFYTFLRINNCSFIWHVEENLNYEDR